MVEKWLIRRFVKGITAPHYMKGNTSDSGTGADL